MKRKAANSCDAPTQIYGEEICHNPLSVGAAFHLPSKETVKKSISRARLKASLGVSK